MAEGLGLSVHFLENLVRNIEISRYVLDVVMVFHRFHQVKDLACTVGVQGDSIGRYL